MNLKLNNDVRGSTNLLSDKKNKTSSTIKEERRRTGRYIAVLVGILLFLLAMYHAWVRRIPIVASLVVPALIMFIYVGWVLYSASREKLKVRRQLLLLDAEAALNAASLDATDNDVPITELQNTIEIAVINTESSTNSVKQWPETPTLVKAENKSSKLDVQQTNFVKPVILINDEPPEDVDLKWTQIVESVTNNEKFKALPTRRKYKRKFCRRRHAVFKRSYSIA